MTVSTAQPYATPRHPAFGRAAVATSQPQAAQAGIAMLQAGGNAIDAAVATAIALTVVEPNNNGVGSDAFAQVWSDGALHGLNGSGRSPRALDPARFRDRARIPPLGWDAVTVPGAVDLWQTLSRRFGALPFADLFAPAIRLAADGFHVGVKTAFYWAEARRTYAAFPAWQAEFCPQDRAPVAGERFRRPALARTLELIARDGADAFYRGELAHRIAACAAEAGAPFALADLDAHGSEWVEPLAQPFAGHTIHELPPNGQGLGTLVALGVLERLDLAAHPVDSLPWQHRLIEATRLGLADVAGAVADPAAMSTSPQELLDPARLDALARRVDLHRVAPVHGVPPAGPDTVLLATADAQGRMVTLIQSNYLGFGSGVVVPGTGISLQNRGHGFVTDPDHPNAVAPGKRPLHTIIPGFGTRDGGRSPWLAFGMMGGHMQAQGHVQLAARLAVAGQNPQTASDAPRWHLFPDGTLGVEAGFDPAVARALAGMGHRLTRTPEEHVFGGAQLIERLEDGYAAGSDHRKEGCAAVL